MATGRSMYPNLLTGHEPGPRILCDDGNGAIPEIVNRMVIQSKPGRLMLLPALPDALPRGTLAGTKARGQIEVCRLSWDMTAGTLSTVLTSGVKQEIALVLPSEMTADYITVNGTRQRIVEQGVRKQGCALGLPKGKAVTVEAGFHPRR